MSDSKTGRKAAAAAATMNQGNKKVITDEQYVKNLRNDLESGLYVAQEGARALLRKYDELLVEIELLKAVVAATGGQQEHTEVLKAIGAA